MDTFTNKIARSWYGQDLGQASVKISPLAEYDVRSDQCTLTRRRTDDVGLTNGEVDSNVGTITATVDQR